MLAPPNPSPRRLSAAPTASSSAVAARFAAAASDAEISLAEWQRWGTASQMPAMVADIVKDMRALEQETHAEMRFGGLGGKLKGDFRTIEDKKHRSVYNSLTDSEEKLQFFCARQVACRLLGSRGYLCQKCWLAMEDCICSKLSPCNLWNQIRFWLYMHPKDFLRQNNTGKLLFQIFGIHAASLCLYGISEHEEIMWDAFNQSGKHMVWFLYPNKTSPQNTIRNDRLVEQCTSSVANKLESVDAPLHFVLLDGTWSNSAAMYRRLKDRWISTWGDDDLPCLSLSSLGASAMHRLRPQPSWDHTCTAAAAAGLLAELHGLPALCSLGLDRQAAAVEEGIAVLLDGLTNRRLRLGRSITRKERHNNCI